MGAKSLSVAVEVFVVDVAESGGVLRSGMTFAARRTSGEGMLVAPRRPARDDIDIDGMGGAAPIKLSEEAFRWSHFVAELADWDCVYMRG